MDHFKYHSGEMHAEEVALDTIAERVGTPFYCYSTATITRHYTAYNDALEGLDRLVCYAMKANGNLAVLRTLANLGIVFSGVGKTASELEQAIDNDIFQINVESQQELDLLSSIAAAKGRVVNVSIRINPDVDAKTHEKITTGKSENKFGIDMNRTSEICAHAATLGGVNIVGIAMHIGSQLCDLEPYRVAYGAGVDLVKRLRLEGYAIERLDLGGGLGISYFEDGENTTPPTPFEYGAMVKDVIGDLDCQIILEPGRVILGNAGVLVARVTYIKQGPSRRFVILDAGMNDLMRPTLYEAHHAIEPVRQPAPDVALETVDIVGPICESGDTFAKARQLPPLAQGDLVVFRTAGAYGAVMASSYNARSLPAEVMVNGADFAVTRRPVTVTDLMSFENMPPWLAER
jgi:diaminopimelate decarboxylase